MSQNINAYLEQTIFEGGNNLLTLGFSHFHHGFLPRLLEAGKDKDFERVLLSLGWCRVAEVYLIIGAPNRAEEMLNKAKAANKNNDEVFFLLAKIQTSRGEHFQALGSIQAAIELFPDRIEFHNEKQRIQDEMNYGNDPLYAKEDPIWRLNELLAEEQFETVINTVLETDMDNIEELKCMARAFGAVGHSANFQQTWNTIRKLDTETTYNPADEFYMPLELKVKS